MDGRIMSVVVTDGGEKEKRQQNVGRGREGVLFIACFADKGVGISKIDPRGRVIIDSFSWIVNECKEAGPVPEEEVQNRGAEGNMRLLVGTVCRD